MAKGEKLFRRDFLKLSGAAGAAAGLVLLEGCKSENVSHQSGFLSLEFQQPEISSSYEFVSSSTGEKLRVLKVKPESLKPKNLNFFKLLFDEQYSRLLDEQKEVDYAVSQIDEVVIIQKEVNGEYVDALLPGSLLSHKIIHFFRDILNDYSINEKKYDEENEEDRRRMAEYFSLIFDPNISLIDKITRLFTYISISAFNKSNLAEEIINLLTLINERSIDIPDNIPWETMFDIYAASSFPILNDPLFKAAEATGTKYGLFIPKRQELQDIKKSLKEMFIPIDFSQPRVFMITYQPPIPIEENAKVPEPVTVIQTIYDDDRDGKLFTAGSLLQKNERLFGEVIFGPALEVPDKVINQAGVKRDLIIYIQEVLPDNVRYVFIPIGMNENKGVIRPALILDDPEKPGDPMHQKVFDLTTGRYLDRVNKNKKNWITDVTDIVKRLSGLKEVFKYGLLTPKEAFGRIFRGNGAENQIFDIELRNMALIPDNGDFVSLLAGLYLEGKTLDQWGVVVGDNNLKVIQISGKDYIFFNNHIDYIKNIKSFGELKRGDFYNIEGLVKIGNKQYVAYAIFHSENGLKPDTKKIVLIPLEEALNNVMVMGTKNELIEALKTFNKIAPWALTAIAAFLEPTIIFSNLRNILIWISKGLLR